MNLWRNCTLIIIFQIPLLAQTQFAGAVPALRSPGFTIGMGYEYLMMQGPSFQSVPLNGVSAHGTIEFSSRWSANVDLGYARATNVLDTRQDGYVVSLLGGPEICVKEARMRWLFIHAFGGSARVDAAVPVNNGYLRGWADRPAFGAGGGIEKPLRGAFGLRVYGDYIHTSFVNSSAAIKTQSNLRSVVSLVFRLPFGRV